MAFDQVVHGRQDDFEARHGDRGRFTFAKHVVVPKEGTQLQVSFMEIPPGQSAYPYHWHAGVTEAYVILSGTGRVRTPGAEFDIGPGEVVHMIARDFQPPPLAYVKVSGGFVRDKAIHYLDLLCWLTGEAPVEAYAIGACLVDPEIGQVGDVDTVMITLKMPSGALCQITNGRRSAFGVHERIEVFGALGLLQWDPDQAGQIAHAAGAGVTLSRTAPEPAIFRQETFAAALDAFIRGVRSGEPLAPSLADGLRAQIIADAATESLASNRPVAIDYA